MGNPYGERGCLCIADDDRAKCKKFLIFRYNLFSNVCMYVYVLCINYYMYVCMYVCKYYNIMHSNIGFS